MHAAAEAADEAADEAALEEQMIADAATARSPAMLDEIRAAAAKRADALRADANVVNMVVAALATGGAAHTFKTAKLLKKPKGTIALIGEGVRTDANDMGDLNDPAYLSSEFRTGGCTAVSVTVTERAALADDALQSTVAEQERARGDFPGPLPILVRDDFVEPIQLAAAAAAGAQMPLLSLALVGADGIAAQMVDSERLGLEPAVRIANEAELEVALNVGAKVICIGDVSTSQAASLVKMVPPNVVTIADFTALDVRGVSKARDMGFNAVIIGKGLFDACILEGLSDASDCLKAMKSKGGVK